MCVWLFFFFFRFCVWFFFFLLTLLGFGNVVKKKKIHNAPYLSFYFTAVVKKKWCGVVRIFSLSYDDCFCTSAYFKLLKMASKIKPNQKYWINLIFRFLKWIVCVRCTFLFYPVCCRVRLSRN
jgi:hypothetical protein